MATTLIHPTSALPQPGQEQREHPSATHPARSSSSSTTTTTTTTITELELELEVPRGPVSANLVFFSPPQDGSPPFNYVEKPPEGFPQRNYTPNPQTVQLTDIRGREHHFTLDNDAFEALSSQATATTSPSAPIDFTSDSDIKTRYYPEVEQLLLANLPGSHRIQIFDHTIRRQTPNAPREPVLRVHVDQTPQSAAQRVRLHLPPKEAESLLVGRYRIVNVWRPISSTPVVSYPLAFASSRSTSDFDLIPIEHRYPDRSGQTAGVKYNPGQKWYYWSGMTSDERLLLKCFDSDPSVGQWGRTPHTAFVDPRTRPEWPGRESIEVRALVFG